MITPLVNREGMGLFPILVRPKSRGSVTLQSNNYWDSPLVDLNILGDEADLSHAIKGEYGYK